MMDDHDGHVPRLDAIDIQRALDKIVDGLNLHTKLLHDIFENQNRCLGYSVFLDLFFCLFGMFESTVF